MKKILFSSIFWMALLCQSTISSAQSYLLKRDSSFNGTGTTILETFPDYEVLNMAILSNGKILSAGYGRNPSTDLLDGYVYCLLPDGTLDAGFGDGGAKLIDLDGGPDAIYGIKELADGKIMVLLESAFRSILIKLNPDGSLDESFGNSGISYVPTADFELCSGLLIQADGKMLILAEKPISGNRYIVTVRRCNPDGSLDETYGNQGNVDVDIDPSRNFYSPKGIIQPDGKLVLTGYFGSFASSGFPVVRLTTDGNFDADFSGDGIYTKIMGNATNGAEAESIAINAEGKIFVGGHSPYFNDNPLTVLSLHPTGILNGPFGSLGVARAPFGLFATARKLIVQSDGKILAGGYSFKNPPDATLLAFARFNANGSLDASFGTQAGRFVDEFDPNLPVQVIQTMELQADARLVCMTWLRGSIDFNDPNFSSGCAAIRYLTDITVRANEPSAYFDKVSVYPNIVTDNLVNLEYSLNAPENVTVCLYNASGMELGTLVNSERHDAKERVHKQLMLPANTKPGTYYIVLNCRDGNKVMKLEKM